MMLAAHAVANRVGPSVRAPSTVRRA